MRELEAENLALRQQLARLRGEKTAAVVGPPKARRRITALFVVLGCMLAPIAVCSVWLRNDVIDTDGYVETVAPLSRDAAIDAAVANRVTSLLFAQVDVPDLARKALPPDGQFLAGPLAAGLRGFTEQTTARVLATDQFNRLWVEANRIAHQQLVVLLQGEQGGVITARGGKVLLDLGRVTGLVQDQLHGQGVTIFDGLRVNSTIELVDSKELARASTWARYLDDVAFIAPLLIAALFAAAVVLSGDRRRTVLRGALGIAFAMAVMSGLVYIGRSIYLDAVAVHGVPRDAAVAFFDTVVRFLRTALRTGFAIGLVVAAGAWASGPSPAAVRMRSTARGVLSGLGEREGWDFGPIGLWVAARKVALRFGALAVGSVVLVWWNRPGPKGVVVVALAVLVILAGIEVVGRVPGRTPDVG